MGDGFVPHPRTPTAAEEIVRRVIPGVTVTDVITRTGGQLSTVAEIRFAEPIAPEIAKIYARQLRWKQENEIHVYRLPAQHGVGPVPTVLHSEGSEGRLGHAITVMTLLDGQPLSAVADTHSQEE